MLLTTTRDDDVEGKPAMAARRVPLVRRTVSTAVIAALALAAAVATSPPAAAADPFCTSSWTGGSGAWSDPTRWDDGTVPAADDYVCILRPDGGAQPTVSLAASTTVEGVTLVGATLRLPAAGTTLSADDVVVTRSLVAGRGTVRSGELGALRFDDARLSGGIRARTDGSVYLTRVLALSGGSQVEQSLFGSLAIFTGRVVIEDADGNPANRMALSPLELEVAPGQDVSIAVPFQLRYATLDVEGTLRLLSLPDLDAAGVLSAADGRYFGLAVGAQGHLVLPRTITAIGPGALLQVASGPETPGGADALADLTAVAGGLTLYRPLSLPHALDVTGGLTAAAPLTVTGLTVRGRVDARTGVGQGTSITTPVVQVEPTGSFSASSLSGRLQSSGTNALSGSRLGGLRLAPVALSTASLQFPTTVVHAARLAGTLKVYAPGQANLPPDGTQVVLLTAGGGLTGQFSGATLQPAIRGTITLAYTPTQVIGTFHAP